MTRSHGPASGVGSRLAPAAWIVIALLIAIVQVVRAEPVDAIVWFATAAGLVATEFVVPPRSIRLPVVPLVGAVVAGVLLTLALSLAPRHGTVEGALVVAIGVVAVGIAWMGPDARSASPRSSGAQSSGAPSRWAQPGIRRTAIAWALTGVACCVWELTSFVLGHIWPARAAEHPAISDLLDPALDSPWFRLVATALWILLGVALVRRGGLRLRSRAVRQAEASDAADAPTAGDASDAGERG